METGTKILLPLPLVCGKTCPYTGIPRALYVVTAQRIGVFDSTVEDNRLLTIFPFCFFQIPSLKPGSALAPQPKKSRRAQTAAKLKSFKSFGRPHAGDFGSGPRNATFGEFSRAQMWGRDGRMAHHPVPMQKGSAFTAEDPQPKGNAKFRVPSSVRLQSSFQTTSSGVSSSLPRTATVLENILLKKASGGM